jgi:lipopolysaccharide heptosyltransferase II
VRRAVRKLLLLLIVVAGFARNGRKRHAAQDIRRILLIRPDHLGDVLFTTPALAEMRQAFPDAHITYLVGPWSREVVARNPNVDEVQTCAFPGFRRDTQGALEPYRLLWHLAGQLRRQEYDLAIVLRPDFWWGVWLVYLAGIPLRLGYAHELQTRFLMLALPVEPYEHATSQNLRLVRAAAYLAKGVTAPQEAEEPTPGKPPLEFRPMDEERAWVRERLAAASISEQDTVVVIHPGTGAPVKLWEAGSWARVADTITQTYGARIVLTGAESERALVEEVASQMREPALALIGETNVGKLAALLVRAALVLGVDNGPLHLATAQGTPTVRLYGPTDPRIFGPWGAPTLHKVLQAKRPCPGCATISCGRLDWLPEELPLHPCVRSVSVEAVLAAVDELLAGKPDKRKEKQK